MTLLSRNVYQTAKNALQFGLTSKLRTGLYVNVRNANMVKYKKSVTRTMTNGSILHGKVGRVGVGLKACFIISQIGSVDY
jgi:hypothetical protein